MGPSAISMTLELFVLLDQGGLYPRRVLIYLAEKNLLDTSQINITSRKAPKAAAGGQPTTLPVLRDGTGGIVRGSIQIIDFFEEHCDARQTPSQTRQDKKQALSCLV